MSEKTLDFQAWMTSKGYTDVRFYPKNAKESSTVDLLLCAATAIEAHENGLGVKYEDSTETYFA